jgi:MoxR-like ATPase
MTLQYEKVFDVEALRAAAKPAKPAPRGDAAGPLVYVYDDDIELAVNVALVTARPLLVAGPPGSGKSSLAPSVAQLLGRRFYRDVISSRTEARDLLWRFDALARLRDAQAGDKEIPASKYIEPGVLWKGFDQDSAKRFAPDEQQGTGAVVLMDEIDKADPDVPNDLLVPLGDFRFDVPDADLPVVAQEPRALVVLTTNDERELPAAFTRRCVVLVLDAPTRQRYLVIAAAHFPDGDSGLHEALADMLVRMGDQARDLHVPPPSTAEYIDAIRACTDLGVDPKHGAWEKIAQSTLTKRRELAAAP